MTIKPISRIVMLVLVLVGAYHVAIIFGIMSKRSQPPVETKATTAASAALPVARRDEGPAGPVTAQAEANADTNDFVPVFDVARVDERTGDAVIAGRATPGAIVELLRNNERHDRAVADQSGRFVMVTPRLPAGNHELTLRSRQPDGRQATSQRRVVVAIEDVKVSSDALNSRAEQAPPPAECAARFAAVSLTNDQGVRAVISNVKEPYGGRVTPCQVQVSFFGADGSLIGNATTEQLKAGESISIPASQPSKLVRAVVSIGGGVDPAKSCLLRTRIEIFDVQTGTTFVSVSGDSVGSECGASVGSGTSRRARVRRAQ